MALGATSFSRRISSRRSGKTFFKILDRALGLRMMARASREPAIPHFAQHPPQRLLGDSDAEFLENPLAEIDDPPAHDPVNRRDWAALDDRSERGAMRVVQPRRLPRRLAVNQPVRALGSELDQQSRTTCSPTPPIFPPQCASRRRKSPQEPKAGALAARPSIAWRPTPATHPSHSHPEHQLPPPWRTSCSPTRSNKFQPIRESPP